MLIADPGPRDVTLITSQSRQSEVWPNQGGGGDPRAVLLYASSLPKAAIAVVACGRRVAWQVELRAR